MLTAILRWPVPNQAWVCLSFISWLSRSKGITVIGDKMGVWAICSLTDLGPLDLLGPNSEYRISTHKPLLNIPIKWIWQCPVHHGKLKPHGHLRSYDQVLSYSNPAAPFQLMRISLLQESKPSLTALGSFVSTSHKLHSNIVNLIPHWLFWVLWTKSQGACTIVWPYCRLSWIIGWSPCCMNGIQKYSYWTWFWLI